MSTKIILRELALSCAIGVMEGEGHVRQLLLLDAEVTLAAPPPDDNAATYDYGKAVVALRALAQRRHYGLMETFAEAAAAVLLENAAATAVRVYVRKPQVFADLQSAGVEVLRQRG